MVYVKYDGIEILGVLAKQLSVLLDPRSKSRLRLLANWLYCNVRAYPFARVSDSRPSLLCSCFVSLLQITHLFG